MITCEHVDRSFRKKETLVTTCVFLDANELVPAAPRDTLLLAAAKGLFTMRLTEDVLHEVNAILVNRIGLSEEKAQRTVNQIREAFPEALVTSYEPLIASMPNDKKDRHVLAAAVSCGAQVIVTQNLRHFSPR